MSISLFKKTVNKRKHEAHSLGINRDKSLLRHAGEGVLITSSGEIIFKGIGVIATFITLFFLTPYEFGLWQLLLSVVTGFMIFTFSGISGVFVADVAHELGKGKETVANYIVSRVFLLFLVSGLAAAFALFIFAPLITNISGINVTLFLWILSTVLITFGFRQISLLVFQAYLKPVHAVTFNGITNVSFLLFVLIFVAHLGYGVLGVVLAHACSRIIPVLLYAPYTIAFLIRAFRYSVAEYSFKDALWKRSKFVLAGDYITTGIASLWPWVTGYFLSIEIVGMISIAVMMISQITAFVPIAYILRAILPHMVSKADRISNWLIRSMRYSLYMHIFASFAILLAAYIIFPIFFPEYMMALPLYLWLLLSLPQRALSSVLGEWFYATKKQEQLFYLTIIPKVLIALLLPPLLTSFGLVGFIVWYILYADLVMIVRLYYVQRRSGIKFSLIDLIKIDQYDRVLLRRALNKAPFLNK